MIEELTPLVLMSTMVLVILVSSCLTLALSALLMWRYRHAVAQAMAETAGFGTSTVAGGSAEPFPSGDPEFRSRTIAPRGADLYHRAMRAPWHNAARYAIAGLAFALVLAAAATQVFPSGLGMAGFAIAVWIYAWPIVLALPLIVPGPMRIAAVGMLAYVAVFVLLGLWASMVTNLPEFRFGTVVVPARSTVTPEGMLRLWFAVNGGPTLLTLLCFNRRVRAVAPLVLALVTTAVVGTAATILMLLSPHGVETALAISESIEIHVTWLALATYVVAFGSFGAFGWLLTRGIARAYRSRRLSDQSLLLDALWLLFASTYGMWLVRGGVLWIASAAAAFITYRLVWAATAKFAGRPPDAEVRLTFLRVFSLGRRSDTLLAAIAGHWRHLSSVQLITGPDLAHSTVQPHQFLDFMSGALSRHFVRDRTSLASRLAERDLGPDPDGRFRINNFFCHADAWQAALAALVGERDIVLMDLRSFCAANAGCIHELRFLVRKVPLDRCVLVIDDTTDADFLKRTLQEAASRLPTGSLNDGRLAPQPTLYRLGGGCAPPVHGLIRRLCDAAGLKTQHYQRRSSEQTL